MAQIATRCHTLLQGKWTAWLCAEPRSRSLHSPWASCCRQLSPCSPGGLPPRPNGHPRSTRRAGGGRCRRSPRPTAGCRTRLRWGLAADCSLPLASGTAVRWRGGRAAHWLACCEPAVSLPRRAGSRTRLRPHGGWGCDGVGQRGACDVMCMMGGRAPRLPERRRGSRSRREIQPKEIKGLSRHGDPRPVVSSCNARWRLKAGGARSIMPSSPPHPPAARAALLLPRSYSHTGLAAGSDSLAAVPTSACAAR